MRETVATVGDRLTAVREAPSGLLRALAGRLGRLERLPTSVGAVLDHYAAGGDLDVGALRLQPRVEDTVAGMVAESFDPVEEALAEEFDAAAVEFEYDTKLLLPVELALARLYRSVRSRAPEGFDPPARRIDPGVLGRIPGVDSHGTGRVDPEFSHLVREVERVERTTELVVAALLDGDMRDAINDDEYDDFEASVATTPEDRRRVARIAQSTLEESVQRQFERFPREAREAYERAVAASESHQAEDPEFRRLMEAARDGDADALSGIRSRYRGAAFEDPPAGYDAEDLALPYFRTQYDRVGVIYDGMMDMYEAVGFEMDDAFRRAVVLAIVGAQIHLDDVDDFRADMDAGQLTPVTAEYLLADSDREGYRRVRRVTDRYLDRAREYATRSGSPLAGIAIEYIRRSGDPSALPGSGSPDGTSGDGSGDRGAT